MKDLIFAYNQLEPLMILNYLKRNKKSYLKFSLHERINVKSRVRKFNFYFMLEALPFNRITSKTKLP